MNADEWVAAFAREVGVDPPSASEVEALLALAGEAAHASERRAAPITTWLAAVAGAAPVDALALARRLAGGVPDHDGEAGPA